MAVNVLTQKTGTMAGLFLLIQLPTLLKKGDVDAYVAWPPFNEIPLVKGFGRALLKPKEMVPHNPCCVIAARNGFVKKNPALFEKIMVEEPEKLSEMVAAEPHFRILTPW